MKRTGSYLTLTNVRKLDEQKLRHIIGGTDTIPSTIRPSGGGIDGGLDPEIVKAYIIDPLVKSLPARIW